MRKGSKSYLARELEKEVCPSFTLPPFDKDFTVLIKDGMGVIQLMAAKSSSSFGAFATSYIDYNLCILKQQQLSWMSLTAMRSKMLSSLTKGNTAPCHQSDTEFMKLMKAAPYMTVEYF